VNSITQKLRFKKDENGFGLKERFFMDSKLDNNKVLDTSGGSNINHNPQQNNLYKSCDAINVEKIQNPN
jgi:hypothetical protein